MSEKWQTKFVACRQPEKCGSKRKLLKKNVRFNEIICMDFYVQLIFLVIHVHISLKLLLFEDKIPLHFENYTPSSSRGVKIFFIFSANTGYMYECMLYTCIACMLVIIMCSVFHWIVHVSMPTFSFIA